MENERLRITLDKTDRIYYSGQTIKGEICLNLTKRTKIRAIKVQITGKGKCKWMEIMRKTSQFSNESARSLFYSSKEIYCHCENTLPVFEPRGLELNVGEHKFDFAMDLNGILPSSFKGSHGSIKYKLRILIQRPWTFDERHKIPITVIKQFMYANVIRNVTSPFKKEITKTVSIFGSKPITLVAVLPKDYALSGGALRICVTVVNNSTTNVDKLRFTILQNIVYYSQVPLRIEKRETVRIMTKEAGDVQKKMERSFAHEILIPSTAQPTDYDYNSIIHIRYELRVEAVLSGLFKNMVLNMPFTLYSADPESPADVSHRSCSVIRSGNPFETSSSSMRVYPSLDSSVGSPSRSSQLSESGSLYSTTSESSATTLSPATAAAAAADNSYRSNDSSTILHENIIGAILGNYMLPSSDEDSSSFILAGDLSDPQSASSQDRSSFILAGDLSDPQSASSQDRSSFILAGDITSPSQTSRQGVRARQNELPPPCFTSASNSSRPSTSALLPPGVDELPPSYEELFGTAPKL